MSQGYLNTAGPIYKNSSGFTLVELMIVIGLISMLVSIALPSYRKFASRARQTEAKLELGNIYTLEVSFALESGSYTTCLGAIGAAPIGQVMYYAAGNHDPDFGQLVCGPNGTQLCGQVSWVPGAKKCAAGPGAGVNYFVANATANANNWAPAGGADLNGVAATDVQSNSFVSAAIGCISTDSTAPQDVWTINNNKSLVNETTAL